MPERYGGWKLQDGTGRGIHIMSFPYRKSVALCLTEGPNLWPVAYFRNRFHAEQTFKLLSEIFGTHEEKPDA